MIAYLLFAAEKGDPMLSIGTAVRSGRLSAPATQGVPAADLAERILRTVDAALARDAPGWLGHCKLMIEAADTVCYASLTEAGGMLSWSGPPTPADQAHITLYCAVYGIDDDQALAAVEQALAAFPEIQADDQPGADAERSGDGDQV
jgi:hypothetical protein